MPKNKTHRLIINQQHEQMLRLVTRSFYNELLNYGITTNQVIKVATYLLDNIMQNNCTVDSKNEYHGKPFTLNNIINEWDISNRLSINDVSIIPLDINNIPLIVSWLRDPTISDNFYPKFPDSEKILYQYLQEPSRKYFSVLHENIPVGLIGAEHIDFESSKLEMRKLIGDPKFHGKGLGQKATFLFLYYAFMILEMNKVYIYSLDINVKNLNLNDKFGFELEGVFWEDALIQKARRDVVRMGLSSNAWKNIFV